MDSDNVILRMLLTPFSQLPCALITETGAVPVTTKSLPFAATELHRIFFLNTNCNVFGEHPTDVKLSMGVGANGRIRSGKLFPGEIFLSQLSSNVFPSVPFFIVTVKFPGGNGPLNVSIIESMSKPLLQPSPVALIIDDVAGEITKSLPSEARLLHFIFLLHFTITWVASQEEFVFSIAGKSGSVMLAVPPSNDNLYPFCDGVNLVK